MFKYGEPPEGYGEWTLRTKRSEMVLLSPTYWSERLKTYAYDVVYEEVQIHQSSQYYFYSMRNVRHVVTMSSDNTPQRDVNVEHQHVELLERYFPPIHLFKKIPQKVSLLLLFRKRKKEKEKKFFIDIFVLQGN